MKIEYVDSSELFHSHGPVVHQHHLSDYYDQDEIGLSTYLQVLLSIALYGFKYAVPVSESKRILDGNFRVFCGEELGLKVPIVICKNNAENRSRFSNKIIWIIRMLFGRNFLFKRKWKNPEFDKRFNNVLMYCNFQKNILDKVKEQPYGKQFKILYLFDIAGSSSKLADYINRNNIGKAYVLSRTRSDIFYVTRSFDYNRVLNCTARKFYLIVIKHLLLFRPDIIHINYWKYGTLFAKIFSPRSKIVFQFHGSDLRGKKIPLYIKLFSNKIIVSTRDLIRKNTEYYGVPLGE